MKARLREESWIVIKTTMERGLAEKYNSNVAYLDKETRTVKHIWFFPTHKAQAKKPKELALPHHHPN